MFRRRPTPWNAALALLTGAGVLSLLFIPAREPAHRGISLDWRPEAEPLLIIGVLALLALTGRRLPRLLRWLVAALICLVALLQWADATVGALLDRQLNLYFDLPHVPGLVGLYWDAAGPWRGALGIAAALLAVLGAVALTARVLAAVERALRRPRHAEVTL
ncbi:MAG TPA: hypothetical protein VE397_11435, partial [Stellaceae bacterium]|nr:hypothetical protein [Stellaceae bacterium]